MEKQRLVFVDLLRGWAVLVMIETHVFNAMVVPNFKDTLWFDVLTFVNGLVAPSFLFVSGFVFILSARRKIEELRTFGPVFWRQVGRIVLILVIAYSLHLPFFSFRRLAEGVSVESWLKFYQADILHCIVIGWLFLLLSVVVIRSEVLFRRWLIGSGLVFVLVAPLMWNIDFHNALHPSLAAYLNGKHYSLFPIFPWLGFMIAGSYVAMRFVSLSPLAEPKQFIVRLTVIGISSALVASLAALNILFGSVDWQANPFFFFTRAGVVLLLFVLCWYYAEKRHTERSFVVEVSRESFLVYVAHLMVIYGKYIGDRNIAEVYGGTFSPMECLIASLVLAALMVGLSKVWGWVKRSSVVFARAVSYTVAVVAVALFFVRES